MDITVAGNVEDKNLPVRPTWAKWNPEVLKTSPSHQLTTPLSKKKMY